MKKLIVLLIICGSLLMVHGISQEKELMDQMAGLQVEVTQLTIQLEESNLKISDLEQQQQYINAVSEDLSDRLAAAQGWK